MYIFAQIWQITPANLNGCR